MAKKDSKVSVLIPKDKAKVNRKGVHSKKKASKLKTSKNYVKTYRGQGK